ncbi:hypothetical protein, partial [Streptomyces sp. NPDC059468]|uniref:hypothetical protein n=1 Tax=Streptomyces sp. NPDC059468 TaxID=3346845 RepID=UPI0036A6D154
PGAPTPVANGAEQAPGRLPSPAAAVWPYLDDCWNHGFTNAWKLWEEIVPLGYKGSYRHSYKVTYKSIYKRSAPTYTTNAPHRGL